MSGWRVATVDVHRADDGPVAWFGSPEQAEFPHGQRRTADSLVATLGTRAGMLVMADRDRKATLDRVRAFLASSPETGCGEFTLPMLTGVLRVRRLWHPGVVVDPGMRRLGMTVRAGRRRVGWRG